MPPPKPQIPVPRPRLHSLASLPPAPHRLAFRSIPYSAPPSVSRGPSLETSTYHCSFFSLRCFPARPHSPSLNRMAVPIRDQFSSPPPWSEDPDKVYTVDFTTRVSKKNVHKSMVVRERCRRKLKEAVRVVVRGGNVDNEGKEVVLSGEVVGPRKWLIPGYTYVSDVTLELYRCPFPTLLQHVKEALASVKKQTESKRYGKALSEAAKEIDQSTH